MKFFSFRRYYLDSALLKTEFSGKVLDVGGKIINRQGSFKPPFEKVESWEYLNIDASTNPDYLCSAESIPVKDNHFDMILLTEVLEHLKNPKLVIKELFRILKDNGILIASMPFLRPVHMYPHDFQRWTEVRIRIELEEMGFTVEKISPMGGIVAVIMDLIFFYTKNPTIISKLIRKTIKFASPLFLYFDKKTTKKDRITTGFYIRARK
jgi:SAM-dependent methyltransferase